MEQDDAIDMLQRRVEQIVRAMHLRLEMGLSTKYYFNRMFGVIAQSRSSNRSDWRRDVVSLPEA